MAPSFFQTTQLMGVGAMIPGPQLTYKGAAIARVGFL